MLAGCLLVVGCAQSVLPPPTSIPAPPLAVTRKEEPISINVPPPQELPPVINKPATLWRPTADARKWKYIVIHHTASATGSVESIHEEHVKKKDKSGNPWLGIGYHFVIGNGQGMEDGECEPTFRWKTQIQGAHAGSANRDYNELGIGVCLVGNFENTPPTGAQMHAVKKLVQTLKTEYRIPNTNIVGHKEVRDGGTECPGKLFPLAEVAAAEGSIWSLGPNGTETNLALPGGKQRLSPVQTAGLPERSQP